MATGAAASTHVLCWVHRCVCVCAQSLAPITLPAQAWLAMYMPSQCPLPMRWLNSSCQLISEISSSGMSCSHPGKC